MLKELRLENFKSFADEQTIPFAPVTVFVGANGSGKSNALDAIRFLQGLGIGLTVAEILGGKMEAGQEIFPGLRGGAAEVGWTDGGEISIGLQTDFVAFQKPRLTLIKSDNSTNHELIELQLQHEVTFDVTQMPIIHKESVRETGNRQNVIVAADQFGDAIPTVSFGPSETKYIYGESEFLSSCLNLVDPAHDEDVIFKLEEYRKELNRLLFYNFRPSEMRGYSDARNRKLDSAGRSLSTVIDTICKDSNSKQRFIEWVGEVCAPAVTDITFVRTDLADVMVQLVESETHKISARSISDGTLRFMALLAALFTCPKGSVILLEEIENGLHPNRIHLLVGLLEQFATSRGIQIIATTHSPKVLQSLSEQALFNAVLFSRSEVHGGTLVRRLGELPHFDEVRKNTDVEELFATGWLEFAV